VIIATHGQGLVTADSLRYHDANDPAFPDVDRQRHGCEGASALDARRCLGSSVSGAALDGEGRRDWTATDMPSIVMVPARLFKLTRTRKTDQQAAELLRPKTIARTGSACWLFNKAE
jgi:hypothetical protein